MSNRIEVIKVIPSSQPCCQLTWTKWRLKNKYALAPSTSQERDHLPYTWQADMQTTCSKLLIKRQRTVYSCVNEIAMELQRNYKCKAFVTKRQIRNRIRNAIEAEGNLFYFNLFNCLICFVCTCMNTRVSYKFFFDNLSIQFIYPIHSYQFRCQIRGWDSTCRTTGYWTCRPTGYCCPNLSPSWRSE